LIAGVNVMDENARIRIYVDNETVASIDFMLLLAHGIGSGESDEKANLPWGIKRMGHAADGAVYNTYRIPFTSSVKITATHPKGGTFWYIIRGVENYPLILGDLMLPANTKLKLYKNVGVSLKPRDFITLADVKSPGAVFLVTLAASSADFNYLEACMRAVIDGSSTTTFLSSGTEDFFLSGYYFNKGIYHFDNSGCTFITKTNATMSAYKFFENDPLLFTKSLQLMWRCGETANGNDGCPNDYPPPSGPAADAIKSSQLSDTVVTTYTWIYEW
jgi:hypothetical protein